MTLPAAENPFRVERIHALPYWDPQLDRNALAARVATPGFRGALVGPHGHGKTTLLHELGAQLRAAGHETHFACVGDAAREENALSVRPEAIFLLDGTERLSGLAWQRLRWRLRAARGVLITAHAPGRLPTLHTCNTSVATVEYLLRALAPPNLDNLLSRAPSLYATHGGDCRAILFALYDEYAGRSGNAL